MNGGSKDHIRNGIMCGWRENFSVLWDKKMMLILKGKFKKAVLWLVMTYDVWIIMLDSASSG